MGINKEYGDGERAQSKEPKILPLVFIIHYSLLIIHCEREPERFIPTERWNEPRSGELKPQ